MSTFNVETTGNAVVEAFGENGKGKTEWIHQLIAIKVVITGPSTDGIGAELALTLARTNPKNLLLLGRTESKIAPVVEQIKSQHPDITISFVPCDLCSNDSVRKAAAQVKAVTSKLDVLINNAGVMAVRTFETSDDGVERQFAAGFLGHFLLTNLLKEELKAAKGLVVNMTSSAYTLVEINTEDPNFENPKQYNPWTAYGRTKTADILFSYALGDKYGSAGVTSFAVDPGMVSGTNLMANSGVDGDLMQQGLAMAVERNGGKPLPPHGMVNLQQGSATALLAALDPSLRDSAPAFVKECAVTPTLPYASDLGVANSLWALGERLVGETFK